MRVAGGKGGLESGGDENGNPPSSDGRSLGCNFAGSRCGMSGARAISLLELERSNNLSKRGDGE